MDEDKNLKLTDLCNLKTIQEDTRGFFNSLLENITTNTRIREWTEDLWKEPLYGEDFIQALIKQEDIFHKIMETFTVSEVYRKKCDQTASLMLVEAEELWKAQKWQHCRERCSQALLRAAVKSPNSSAASEVKSNSVRQCALLLRARCLLKEGRVHIAKIDLNSCLQQGTLQDSSKKELREIFQEIQKLNLETIKHNEPITDDNPSVQPSVGKHETLPSASKLICVSENAEQGRFLSAAEDIRIGDNLVVEQPYAACLKPQNFGTHCHHCFKRLEAPFGCPECVTVAFCSEKCSSEAISTYHQYECKFMDLFIGSGMSILCHIALRMVTQISLNETIIIFQKYLSNKYSKNKNATLTSEESDENINNMFQHEAVYKLCTHEQYRQPEDYIRRTLMAFFLTRCLQKTSFFSSKSASMKKLEFGSDEIAVWCVLLFNLQVLQFNAHQVCGIRGEINLGCALYTTAALFNHECCPSVTRFFLGKRLIIKALRPVPAGDVVGDSYGPQWGRSRTEVVKAGTEENRESRQRELRSRYWFLCKCRACSQQWPLPPSPSPSIRCSDQKCDGFLEENSQSAKCTICTKVATLDYVKQKHDALKKCLEKIKDGEAIQNKENKLRALADALMEYGQLTHQPCPTSLHAEDTIRSCYAAILSPRISSLSQ